SRVAAIGSDCETGELSRASGRARIRGVPDEEGAVGRGRLADGATVHETDRRLSFSGDRPCPEQASARIEDHRGGCSCRDDQREGCTGVVSRRADERGVWNAHTYTDIG